MTTSPGPAPTGELVHERTMRRLHELIAALDRRVSNEERIGEISVVRAAAALRIQALNRLLELERNAGNASPATDMPLRAEP